MPEVTVRLATPEDAETIGGVNDHVAVFYVELRNGSHEVAVGPDDQ